MTTAAIDLILLKRAQTALIDALRYWNEQVTDSPLKPPLRAGVIQSLEFVYELSVRALRRVLIERSAAAASVADLSFNDLLRVGADAGLLTDPARWRTWRELRDATGHAYDQAKAQAVAVRVADFAADAERLRVAMEAELDR